MPTCQGSPNKKATAGASQGTKAVVKSICRHTTSLSPFYLRTGLGGGATSNILELNTSENGEIYFVCTRLVFPTNSMQSLHDGDRWTWQDHLALQVHTYIILKGLQFKSSSHIRLKLGKSIPTVPTPGFNVESVRHKGVDIQIWEGGGGSMVKPLYKHHYPGTHVVVYMVDSIERQLFTEVRQELKELATSEDLAQAHLLVLANKSDSEGALGPEQLWEELSLANLGSEEHNERLNSGFLRATVLPICATTGHGCQKVLDWLANIRSASGQKF